MKWILGIVMVLLVAGLFVGCTYTTDTPVEGDELGLDQVESLDGELDVNLEDSEVDQILTDLDEF